LYNIQSEVAFLYLIDSEEGFAYNNDSEFAFVYLIDSQVSFLYHNDIDVVLFT